MPHDLITLDPKFAYKVHELVPGMRGGFDRWQQPYWAFPSWQVVSRPQAIKLFSESDSALDRLQAALLSQRLLDSTAIAKLEVIVPPFSRLPGFFPWEREYWDGIFPEPAGPWEVWRFRNQLYGFWEGFLAWNSAKCEGLLLDIDWSAIALEEPSDPDDEEGDEWEEWEHEYEDKLHQFLCSFESTAETGMQLSLVLA